MAALIVASLTYKKQSLFWGMAIVTLWSIGWFLKGQTWTHSIGEPVKVALIQGNVRQDQKWLPENKVKTLLMYKALTEQHWGTPIIVLARNLGTGFLF